jgi:cytochrome c553
MRFKLLLLTCTSIFFVSSCNAETSSKSGKELAVVCAGCHGDNGISNIPIYPNLSGQKGPYLEMALKAYRGKSRTGLQANAMYSISANLSDADIKALAKYYSSMKR